MMMEKMLMDLDEIPSKKLSWARATEIPSNDVDDREAFQDADYELQSDDEEESICNNLEMRNNKYMKKSRFHLFSRHNNIID